MTMRILGICAQPDGFCTAVVSENRVVSAVEQFKIRQHWSPREKALLPKEAILTSLRIVQSDPSEVDIVAFTSEFHSAETIIPEIRRLDLNARAKIEHVDDRIAHAAAAFYSSPFDRAAILILGIGSEPGATCLAVGHGPRIELEDCGERHRALSELYGCISRALGFHARTSNKVAWLGSTGELEFLDMF